MSPLTPVLIASTMVLITFGYIIYMDSRPRRRRAHR